MHELCPALRKIANWRRQIHCVGARYAQTRRLKPIFDLEVNADTTRNFSPGLQDSCHPKVYAVVGVLRHQLSQSEQIASDLQQV